MRTTILNQVGDKLTISVELTLSGGMLDMEEQILCLVNELGVLSTRRALELQDTDGECIDYQGLTYSSKGKEKKK